MKVVELLLRSVDMYPQFPYEGHQGILQGNGRNGHTLTYLEGS